MSDTAQPPRDPIADTRLLQQVQEALAASDIARAIELARQALSGGQNHPLLLNLRAFWLEQQGQDTEALADLAAAAAIAPNDPLINNAYGLQLAKMMRREPAIAAFRKAIALDPNFAPAHFNLGWALESVGDVAGSRQSYERAISLNPNFAQALAHLANLAARRADWTQAHEFADRSLAIDPNQHMALRAKAVTAVADGDHDGAERFIKRLSGNPAMPAEDRAIAYSILGDLRHAQGRYPDAFEAYAVSNARQRDLHAPRFARDGIDSAAGYAQWLVAQFEKQDASRWAAEPGAYREGEAGGAAGHAFLVGFPRSGTTLLENVLAAHPKIVALEEKELFREAVLEFMSARGAETELKAMSAADSTRHRAIYWRNAANFGADVQGKVFIDKHPLHSIKLPLVAKLFPHAKILFAVRDPRDVVLSCFRRAFQINASMYEFLTLEGTARYYDTVMRVSMLYRQKLGLAWREVRHEALLDDFTGETQSICAFLGVEWSAEMAAFAQSNRARDVATASSAQVSRGLNRESVEQWRNYKGQLAPVLPILRPWIRTFGYPED